MRQDHHGIVVGQVGIDGKLYVLKSFYVKYDTIDSLITKVLDRI